jgi:hypothetical protein
LPDLQFSSTICSQKCCVILTVASIRRETRTVGHIDNKSPGSPLFPAGAFVSSFGPFGTLPLCSGCCRSSLPAIRRDHSNSALLEASRTQVGFAWLSCHIRVDTWSTDMIFMESQRDLMESNRRQRGHDVERLDATRRLLTLPSSNVLYLPHLLEARRSLARMRLRSLGSHSLMAFRFPI